ncbi:hypothetical protein V500_02148 [Pseudogymnoascus sp. VKM F-4518 (FW-2643)]|nr:hypothetical protein V500_02148 [Pseudogymnoascus sp. VKM F-4518 (FW-2643)]
MSSSITPDRRISDMKPTYYPKPKPGWWEKAGLDVLNFGYFTDTRLVRRFNLFSDPTTANNAFHERQRQCSPSNSCGSNWESGDQEPSQESEKIDDRLQQGNPPAPTWDMERILSDLASSTDATNIAEKLDFYTWSKLCHLSFDSWARFTLGYDEPTVSKFVRDLSALRNDLAIRFQELGQPQVWILVGEASQERNPLLRWLLSSCISENESQSDPHAAISFILEPIEHLFSRETDGVIYVLKRLSILATRFRDSMRETTYNKWQRAFRNEFTFFDNIHCNTPETHADSIVQADSKLFAGVSTSDLVRLNSQQLGLIGIVWNRLCSDVTASVDADYDLSVRISKVAVRLIFLGDYHSATAILTGLRAAGIDLEELSQFWHLIDMKDNFGAYRAEVSKRPGSLIPFAFPHVRQLLLHGDTTEGLDRPIAVEGGLEGKGPDFDCPIAMAGRAALDLDGGLEGRTFLGIPDLADPRSNDTAFYFSPKLSKHYDSSPAKPKNAPSPTIRLGQMVAIKQQPKLSLAGVHPNPPSIVAYTSGATTAQDAQSPRFFTSNRNENSFYGHPVINGQDIKKRIARHVTIAKPSRKAGSKNLMQRAREAKNSGIGTQNVVQMGWRWDGHGRGHDHDRCSPTTASSKGASAAGAGSARRHARARWAKRKGNIGVSGSRDVFTLSRILTVVPKMPNTEERADANQETATVGLKSDFKTLQQLTSSSEAAKKHREDSKDERAKNNFFASVQAMADKEDREGSKTGNEAQAVNKPMN